MTKNEIKEKLILLSNGANLYYIEDGGEGYFEEPELKAFARYARAIDKTFDLGRSFANNVTFWEDLDDIDQTVRFIQCQSIYQKTDENE